MPMYGVLSVPRSVADVRVLVSFSYHRKGGRRGKLPTELPAGGKEAGVLAYILSSKKAGQVPFCHVVKNPIHGVMQETGCSFLRGAF